MQQSPGLVQVAEVRAWLEDHHGHGVRRAREAVALCDPRAESLPESICRVRLLRAGLVVVPQVTVRDANGFVARLDLAVEGLQARRRVRRPLARPAPAGGA